MRAGVTERRWTIDVCRTCDRLAVWPFCEHRPEGGSAPAGPGWCVSIVVRPVGRAAARSRDGQPHTDRPKPSTPPPGPSGVSSGPDGRR